MDNVAAVEEHGAALLERAQTCFDAPVTGAPGWDVGELVAHIGRVWGLVESIVRTRASARPEPPVRPDDRDDWWRWAAANHAALLEQLRGADPTDEVWNWSRMPNVAAFWPRRMAQETIVHRWDVDNAAGHPSPIPKEFAADGIDEFFDAFLPLLQSRGPIEGLHGSLHLHATDEAGEWLVHLEPSSFAVTHEHAKGDAAVRGTASDLLLFVWNRIPASTLEVFGNTAVVEQWAEKIRI